MTTTTLGGTWSISDLTADDRRGIVDEAITLVPAPRCPACERSKPNLCYTHYEEQFSH